jgi:membrane-bound serine protease (ClpP class)
MEILVNPNVAYVLLVAGGLLTFLAILAPGTGMLEVGAVFALVVAGYITYRIGMNPWALIVLVMSIVPFIYATRKPKRGLWLASSILAFLGGSVYLFNTQGWVPKVNPVLAVIISLLFGGFIWLVVGKTIQANLVRPIHDLESLIGVLGETRTEVHESGSAQIAGELWTVRSDKKIPAECLVRVVGREGFVLLVEKADDKDSA